MVVWRGDDGGGTLTHYSSVRPPGGAWGAPQVIVSDDDVSSVQFALTDNGTAVAVVGRRRRRPGRTRRSGPRAGVGHARAGRRDDPQP